MAQGTLPNPCFTISHPDISKNMLLTENSAVLVFSSIDKASAYLDAAQLPGDHPILKGTPQKISSMYKTWIVDPTPKSPGDFVFSEHGPH